MLHLCGFEPIRARVVALPFNFLPRFVGRVDTTVRVTSCTSFESLMMEQESKINKRGFVDVVIEALHFYLWSRVADHPIAPNRQSICLYSFHVSLFLSHQRRLNFPIWCNMDYKYFAVVLIFFCLYYISSQVPGFRRAPWMHLNHSWFLHSTSSSNSKSKASCTHIDAT